MPGINKVMLVGHLGKDPDLQILEGDIAVLRFPLATAESFTKGGIKTEQAEWHNITMWRAMAEHAAKVLKKGKLIYLEGKLKTYSFEDKEGIKRFTTEIIAENFRLLGRLKDFEEQPVIVH